MQKMKFDTIVAGSGLAGLTAAWYASQHGTVALITKSELDTSNSYHAQGGIAGAIGDDDTPELHYNDTMVAGRGLCEGNAVDILVREGKDRIMELISMGMPFDRKDGKFVLGLEGGHSRRRILHAGGDATGKELTCFMLKKVQEQSNIFVFPYTAITKIIVQDGVCAGVLALDFQTGENVLYEAPACILATGGLSRIFSRTTNPHTATGDGISLAWEAGAQLEDMEFIQFHPTAICIENQDAFLISEAVRGEGAWLLNKNGERFMTEIHPLSELAPRDVVAFSIYQQMKKDNIPFVHLSLKHLDSEKIKSRFSNIYKRLQDFGYDLTSDLLPVAPAAHYMVGGIKTDENGQTNIPGLFACGEVASTGVMGANRLASNSLLECLVFGKRASEKAATFHSKRNSIPDQDVITNKKENEQLFLDIKNEIADLMSLKVGIIRNETDLVHALERLEKIQSVVPTESIDYNIIKCNQIIRICKLIIQPALLRKESRGGHIRKEYKLEDPDFQAHIVQQKDCEISFIPVKTLNNQMTFRELDAARRLIDMAFDEDIAAGDITTNNLIPSGSRRKAYMVAKDTGVIAGLQVAEMVFRKLDPELVWNPQKCDGDSVKKGEMIVRFKADYRAILTGERTALNFLQRMSGIATATAILVNELRGFNTKILDTRKTLPGFRLLDKYSVKTGGGINHRIGLYDMVMIKDNHIDIAGGIMPAVKQIRSSVPASVKIEVEAANMQQVQEAIDAKADIIMLDNMDNETMKKAVELIGDKAKTEASGNMTIERLKSVAATGVDYISVGGITHSVKALDISQRIES